MPVKITTDNIPREVLNWIPGENHGEFDYIDWRKVQDGEESVSFVKYKGEYYDLNDTEGVFPADNAWVYISGTFFSGKVFKFPDNDAETVICGTYYEEG